MLNQNDPIPARCHALWVGKRLGPVASSCLHSFVRLGHPVHLHSYEPIEDLPEGVIAEDASQLVPADAIFRHERTGSLALFSDYFRYRLLEAGLGLYIDCDVIAVRPIPADESWVCGWQDNHFVNGAILRIPPDSPVLADLLAIFARRVFVPPWLPLHERVKGYMNAFRGAPTNVRHAEWGAAGPVGITHYMRRRRKLSAAAPREVYYPLPWPQSDRLADPNVSWSDLIAPSTRCIHLWNHARVDDEGGPPKGSPLWELLEGRWPEGKSQVLSEEGRSGLSGRSRTGVGPESSKRTSCHFSLRPGCHLDKTHRT